MGYQTVDWRGIELLQFSIFSSTTNDNLKEFHRLLQRSRLWQQAWIPQFDVLV